MSSILLRVFLVLALAAGAALTALGLLADRWPALELINHFRPALTAALLLIALLAPATRRWPYVAATAAVALVNIALIGFAMRGAAPEAAAGPGRPLRVVTFNLQHRNPHMDKVADYLKTTEADVIVLQEVTAKQRESLRAELAEKYPHLVGTTGVVMLSRHPLHANGSVNGPKIDGWARVPLILSARVEVGGSEIEIAGLHLAYPFNPLEQAADTPALIDFVRTRNGPLIVAGDYNLTPWSMKLQQFGHATGLRRYVTFLPTWPMDRLTPFVTIDNVFASTHFTSAGIAAGPWLGSDHRALVVDLVLAGTAKSASLPQ